jgi:hypothetical protein
MTSAPRRNQGELDFAGGNLLPADGNVIGGFDADADLVSLNGDDFDPDVLADDDFFTDFAGKYQHGFALLALNGDLD